ncbi:hypothetical protein [Notoacmeibacter ruber]|uniref:NADH-quinone oxidoreductase subunit E n=1 Tax=Notoacmeibacter ruber TaxID=2670375 RepID=A0A3L7JDC5_9HYPH|nr:hypothetical protein [Notoacmeibacter ruber]RLQ87581.1 hypothetical protein D8780_04545 [Notoacmeibacter ruber]
MSVSLPFIQALILFAWAAVLGAFVGWLPRRLIFVTRGKKQLAPSVSPSQSHRPAGRARDLIEAVSAPRPVQPAREQTLPRTQSWQDLAELSQASAASAMAGAGRPATSLLPPAKTEERWALRVERAPRPTAVTKWPRTEEVRDSDPPATDWRAAVPEHGDYALATSVDAAPFRPLDPAIRDAVLGIRTEANEGEDAPPSLLGESEQVEEGAEDAAIRSDAPASPDKLSPTLAIRTMSGEIEHVDLAALGAARFKSSEPQDSPSPLKFLPSQSDESVRLQVSTIGGEQDPLPSVYEGEDENLSASRGREDWRPKKADASLSTGAPPFRPIGDLGALSRSRWGLPAVISETMDEIVKENSVDEHQSQTDTETTWKGRLWGPAVALPLPSAVASRALAEERAAHDLDDDDRAEAGASTQDERLPGPVDEEADAISFEIGMDDDPRQDRLAEAADDLAAEAGEELTEDIASPSLVESEMQQVSIEDEALDSSQENSEKGDLASEPSADSREMEEELDPTSEPPFEDMIAPKKGAFSHAASSPREPQPIEPPLTGDPLMDRPADAHGAAGSFDPPAGSADPSAEDDLSRIRGVGPATERRLHELGVTRYEQIAAWGPDEAAWIGEQLFFPGRVERENWIELARQLIDEQEKRRG